MWKNGLIAFIIILAALFWQKAAFAAEIVDLPEDELAKESVLPVFDKSESVRNRSIVTEGRIDGTLLYGMALTEPIANVSKFGISAYYNINETHAVGILYAHNSAGLSNYATQLESQFPAQVQSFSDAPMPQNTLLIDYNAKAFYGKMSLSKSLVMNTILLGSVGLGMVQYTDNSYPTLALGIGQKFYFNRHWALRFDLRLYANEAPIPFVAPSASPTYDTRLTFTTNLDVGLSYLF